VTVEHPTSHFPEVLRPASGVRLFLTEQEGILFDEVGQKLFHLNSMAACIWCHIEEQSPIDSVIHFIARVMHLNEVQAHRFVLNMIRTWWRLGLLHGGRCRASAPHQDFPVHRSASRSALTTKSELTKPYLHYYQLLDTTFSLDYAYKDVRNIVHPILAHLEMSRPSTDALPLDTVRTGDEWRILLGNGVLGSCRDLGGLAPMVQGTLSSLALRRCSYLLALHAGGIARQGRAMLLVGESRSGKTTLTAAMLGEGWDYLSDDMILMERDSLDAKAVPCSLGIKPGGWELLASRFPGCKSPRQHLRADGQVVGYFSPPLPQRGFVLPRTVQWIVFPYLSPAAPGNVRALGPLEGLQRLMSHCCGIPSALRPEDIHRLIEWGAGVDWFELTVADLDTAVARLKEIATEDWVSVE
jgi:hypothetical protein